MTNTRITPDSITASERVSMADTIRGCDTGRYDRKTEVVGSRSGGVRGSQNGNRTGVRYTAPRYDLAVDEQAHGTFLALTDGLTGRMRHYPGIQAKRAGTQIDPLQHIARFLCAARQAGLRKDWAERLLTSLRTMVDGLWPMDPTPVTVRARQALEAEAACNLVEQAHPVQHVRTREEIDALIGALEREVTEDLMLIAALRRMREGAR